MASRLSDEQVRMYEREGYTLFREPVFAPDKFATLKAHFEEKLAAWEAEGGVPEHMDTPHFADPALFDWLLADEVLDLVEPLIGPDIALWSSHFISKPPGTGRRVPWHEDSAYWGQVLDPMEVATVWLAIDPATPDNGCMRVIPGTHHHGYSDYEDVADPDKQVFATEIKRGQVDENKAVDITLEPNQCSIHHAKLVHGSNPNTGSIRRCGYTMRYISTRCAYRPEKRSVEGFQIYLARGEDRAGNKYGDPTKINEAWFNANAEHKRRMKALAH